jgi:hypothetical protein
MDVVYVGLGVLLWLSIAALVKGCDRLRRAKQ